VPKEQKVVNDAAKGTIISVDPEPGQKAKKGATVTFAVSAGVPEVAFDNGENVLLANGSNGKPIADIAQGPAIEEDPTFSPDGGSVAFKSDGQIFLRDLTKKDATNVPITSKEDHFTDLAWAPTTDGTNVLALVKREGDDPATAKTSLCFAKVDADGTTPRCKPPSPNLLGRKINWSRDGRTLLVWGAKPPDTFGMVEYTSKKPFSSDPAAWKSKGFVTDTSRPREGALDAAPSPDGKSLAVVSLGKSGRPELFVTKRNDFLLQSGKRVGVIACKVAWRGDSKELLVVRADDCLGSSTGNLVRVKAQKSSVQRSLRLDGDHPTFRPLNVE
jgi:Tol biopolymer transport system component